VQVFENVYQNNLGWHLLNYIAHDFKCFHLLTNFACNTITPLKYLLMTSKNHSVVTLSSC